MGSKPSKSESKPRELEGWEQDIFEFLGDFYDWQTGEYPPEESFIWFETGMNDIINGLQGIPEEIREMIVPYLGGIDAIMNKREQTNELFLNTVKSLGGISKQIANNPKVYDARFKHMKRLRQQEYNTWSKEAANADKDLAEIERQMPTVNMGGISMKHQPRNAQARRDSRTTQAGEGRNAAIGGMEDIAKGFMNTRTGSQAARANISGEMIPNTLNSISNNLSEMTGLLGNRLDVETMPQQWEAQLAGPAAELMTNRYAALMDPYAYIKEIQLARSGQAVNKSKGESGGFAISTPVGGVSF